MPGIITIKKGDRHLFSIRHLFQIVVENRNLNGTIETGFQETVKLWEKLFFLHLLINWG